MLEVIKKQTIPTDHKDSISQVLKFYKEGKYKNSISLGEIILVRFPKMAFLHNVLGAANANLGNLNQSVFHFKKFIELDPNNASIYNNLGAVLIDLKNYEEAQIYFEKAIQLRPTNAEAYNNLGITQTQLKKYDSACGSFQHAIKLNPLLRESYSNLGSALSYQGKYASAIISFEKAITIDPNYDHANQNLFEVMINLDPQKAILKLKNFLSNNPSSFLSAHVLAQVYEKNGLPDEAIKYYKLAIRAKCDHCPSYNNLGLIYSNKEQFGKAVQVFKNGLRMCLLSDKNFPGQMNFYKNAGRLFSLAKQFNYAKLCFEKALQIDPACENSLAQKIFLEQLTCNWSEIEKYSAYIKDIGISTVAIEPFSMLFLEDDPERQFLRTAKYTKSMHAHLSIPFNESQNVKSKKIRVGYFSADFKEHPIANQIIRVLELHDRRKFEIFAYSFGNSFDEMTSRVVQSVDNFKDVTNLSDKDIALLARKDNIDIAIDLMGHTHLSRLSIFAFRAAKIQIHLFGSTTGAKFMDYIVADPIVIPSRFRAYYQEKIIYLPNSYMPTDDSRRIAKKISTRQEMNLPKDGFIFCCFNANYKITKCEFDIWMRLLQKVERSVLWLTSSNHQSKKNLRLEALNNGIDPSRLIFTDRVSTEDHLARHKQADIFLDTFNFNAQSTAIDALWAGLPVITKLGSQFDSRSAASYLNAIGLPELIVETNDDYESLCLELAINSQYLKSIKKKLAVNRKTTPLFNSKKYTRNLELAFEKSLQNSPNFKLKSDIWVKS